MQIATMHVYCILFYTRVLNFTRVYMCGLMPHVFFAFAHAVTCVSYACDTHGPFKLWVICTVYYIEILGVKNFLLKATMASEIHATSKTFDLKSAK